MCTSLLIFLASIHFVNGNYNEENYGVGINCNNFIAATYKNSYNKQSVLLGYHRNICNQYGCIGLAGGSISGYRYPVFIAPTLVIGSGNVRLTAIPSPYFIGLGLEIRK